VSVIADISVVLAWLFEEDQTAEALKILPLIQKHGLLVPPLWWSELENGILLGERRGRKTPAQTSAFLKLVRALPIRTDDTPRHRVSESIIALGRRHRLTAYDAAYVELSLRDAAPLATFDDSIRRCAPALGIEILPAIKPSQ
jgi:predicted nucleic acid-binding protein